MAFGAVNRHGMISFLVANLLTGFVNLVVPTIDQPDGIAMGILIVYLLAVGGAALGLESYAAVGSVGKTTTTNDAKVADGTKID